MTDDPRWNGTGYSPEKAWAEIKRKDSARELESRHPTKWWHDFVFGWGGLLVIVGFAASVIGAFFGLWGILR